MNCNCIETINNELSEHNLELDNVAIMLGEPVATLCIMLGTAWKDRTAAPRGKRNSTPSIKVSYCPFCGVAVETQQKETP